MKILLDKERKNLLIAHKKERDKKICDRIKAVLCYDAQESIDQISKFLFVAPSTVKTYIKEYLNNSKLKPQNGGSESKLTDKERKELCNHLENHTYIKVEDIISYILKTYGVKYTISGLTKWLKRVGFSYKKPKGIPKKTDIIAQKEFEAYYKNLESNLDEEEEILFMDSCHPTQATKLSYGWIKKGKDKEIKTSGSRTRVNITGAINIKTRKIINENYETINSESTIKFLEKVEKSYPESKKIHIVLDGASYHKSKEVEEFIKEKRLKLHILPPYSPNLNSIERLWKIMNKYARNNKYFENAKSFRESINNFFKETIPNIYDEICNTINSNFQIFGNTS